MAKFDKLARMLPAPITPVVTTGERTINHQGGAGYVRDVQSELFLLATTNFVSESTFYETARDRDNRFVALVRQAAVEHPDWTARLIKWLRSEANMRSASIVAAAEYAHAGGPNPRSVISSALQRADEPGEFLAYWRSKYGGSSLSGGKQRGVADAVLRLYNEWAALKWDGQSHAYRFGDVIELSRPKPTAAWQHELFRWLIDRRHNRTDPRVGESLDKIRANQALLSLGPAQRRAALAHPERLAEAGMTWESLAGWLQGPMDQAAWEAIIPSMGYMALLRNLRNFDEAKVSDKVAQQVAARLADPEQVAKSRQLPLRFLSAYKAVPSLRWAWPLEQAVGHSLANVPALPGRSLILIDLSQSMWNQLSERSELQRWEAAALFGLALGLRAASADVYVYGSAHQRVTWPQGSSLLPTVKGLNQHMGGTNTFGTLEATFTGHDRIIILTDEQARQPGSYSRWNVTYGETRDPETVLRAVGNKTVITVNVAGYAPAHMESGANRITISGLSDAAFNMIDLLDKRAVGTWPF